jgi:hypothetical protein
MRRHVGVKGLAALFLWCSGSSWLVGATIDVSFTGTFKADDNVQLFRFTIPTLSNVIARTWSFASGVNAAGQAIPDGGFAPVLSLFGPSGDSLGIDKDGGTGLCGPRAADPISGFCWDAYINQTLGAGTYTLALTEDDNTPVGSLSEGFTEAGNGNFTGPLFLGPSGAGRSFILADGEQRTPDWAVDIDGVQSAAELPEPAAPVLLTGGLALLFWVRRAVAAKSTGH